MTLHTAFTELFAVERPIALAPMGGAAGGALAAAVSNGGGLGLVGGSREELAGHLLEVHECLSVETPWAGPLIADITWHPEAIAGGLPGTLGWDGASSMTMAVQPLQREQVPHIPGGDVLRVASARPGPRSRR